MKKSCFWTGTDSLTLVVNPPSDSILWYFKLIFYRLKWKILHKIFSNHYIVHERLRQHLLDFGIPNEKISVRFYDNDSGKKDYTAPDLKKYDKIPHEGFNILYYHPKPGNLGGETYVRWKYGIDVIEDIMKIYPDCYFIKVDGSQPLSQIYPITDFYLRPSRHDGLPRINLECEANDIPFYYSEDGEIDIYDLRKKIEECYRIKKIRDFAPNQK